MSIAQNGGMDPAPDALLDRRSSQELADLRRRAYGPEADIATDPVAMARLAELEALGRAAAPRVAPPEPIDLAPESVESRADAAATSAPPPEDGPAEESDSAESDAPERPRARRTPRWLWAVVAVVAVAAAVATFLFVTQPRVEDTLIRAGDSSAEPPTLLSDTGFLGYIQVDEDAFVPYEPYRGIVPWVASRRIGGSCVVLVLDGDAVGYGCGLGDLNAVADLVVDGTDGRWTRFDLREGSILRFTLRGDVVDVQVAEVPAPEPTVTD